MPAKRKPPPEWWLLGYMAQYQPNYLIERLEQFGVDPQVLYIAASAAAVDLPKEKYRKLAKTWAVRQYRIRSGAGR